MPSQLYGWRRQLCGSGRSRRRSFAAVRIAAEAVRARAAMAAPRDDRDRACERERGCGSAGRAMLRRCRRRSRPLHRRAAAMIPMPSGVRVWLATGHTDMRKGFDGLALLVQETLKRNPHSGHLFVFRGRRGVADQGAVARRPGHVPVRQAAGARPLHLAIDRPRDADDGDDHAGAAGIFAGRHRLAPAAAHVAPASGGLIATL